MSAEYETRLYQPNDELQIAPLLKSAYGHWPFFDIKCSPVDHWRWKYIDSPHHKNLLIEILHENEIIASSHNIMHNLIINGKKYLASYGTDACVHPKFQGRGLYKILMNSYAQHVRGDFTYMVTVNPKVLSSSSQKRETPYRFPYIVKSLNRISDINQHINANELNHETRRKLKHLIDRARSSPIIPPDPNIKITQVNQFDKNIESFLEQVNESYKFIKHRTRDYLNWRYLDPRAGNYNVRMVVENETVIGYGVFRINKLEKYHVGYIVDLLTFPDRLDTAEALLLDGLGLFRDNKVNQIVSQVVEKNPFERLFNKYGFYGGDGNRHIFYNYTGDDDLGLDKISSEKFHFVFGDLTGI